MVISSARYRLGRLAKDKVGDDLELPSDIVGIFWIAFDTGWQQALANELGAGDEIDPLGYVAMIRILSGVALLQCRSRRTEDWASTPCTTRD
jgi:hypothetical protein